MIGGACGCRPPDSILEAESWMNICHFRALHDAGASYAEIARECVCGWPGLTHFRAGHGEHQPFC